MSSTCYAISHAFGTHHIAEAAYLCSWTALFFSFSHAQTHFSPLFQCYWWKDITVLTLLHSSQQESCLLTNVNWSVSTERKNAIQSDWLNK